MTSFLEVPIAPRSLATLARHCPEAAGAAGRALSAGRAALATRTIWNVNSTARGGGVAELLASLLPFARGADITVRWGVIGGDDRFFHVTKRLHNALHGATGDGSPLDEGARAHYERVLRDDFAGMRSLLRPGDVVILHDPQTAGLCGSVARLGCTVVWRCHIGIDAPNDESDRGWRFLAPYLADAHAFVFSRDAYIPSVVPRARCTVISPSIDPTTAKNQAMTPTTVRAIVGAAGLVANGLEGAGRETAFERADGSIGAVTRTVDLVHENGVPPADAPLVVQVSRWDRLKDPIGVIDGFAHMARAGRGGPAHLLLAGPQVDGVHDDPEGAETFAETRRHWRDLPAELRRRVHLACLPMADVEENAAMVNALQRHAAVVVQKSVREGFGLTVTEAMWKGRPMLASRVGGIQDQIEHGRSGLLLVDPKDPEEFAAHLADLLDDRALADRLGEAARQRVRERFLPDSHLGSYAALLQRCLAEADTRKRGASA